MNSPLAGKTALVTGGARRIGQSIVLALAGSGVHVVVHYNTADTEADETVAAAKRFGVPAWKCQADLASPSAAQNLIDRTCELSGGLDFLVNSASVFPSSGLETITAESIERIMTINAFSPLALSERFVEQAEKGAIVTILDNRIDRIDLAHAAYQLSKNTLATLTRMMAVKYAPGIQVNAVAPGMILPPEGKDKNYLARMTDRTLLRRHGSPEDIATAVLFLLANDFITGEVIVVDGGENLKRATYD